MAKFYRVVPGSRVAFSRSAQVLEMTLSEARAFRAYLSKCPEGSSPSTRRVLAAVRERDEETR